MTTMTQEGMMGTEMGRHLTELRRRARKDNKPKTRDKRAKDKREIRDARKATGDRLH